MGAVGTGTSLPRTAMATLSEIPLITFPSLTGDWLCPAPLQHPSEGADYKHKIALLLRLATNSGATLWQTTDMTEVVYVTQIIEYRCGTGKILCAGIAIGGYKSFNSCRKTGAQAIFGIFQRNAIRRWQAHFIQYTKINVRSRFFVRHDVPCPDDFENIFSVYT